jgi:hypothetical protein
MKPIIFLVRYRSGELRIAARHPHNDYFAPFMRRYFPSQEEQAHRDAKALAVHLGCDYSDEVRDLL